MQAVQQHAGTGPAGHPGADPAQDQQFPGAHGEPVPHRAPGDSHRGSGVPGRLPRLRRRSTRSSSRTPRSWRSTRRTSIDTWQSETDATKKAALEKDLFDQLGHADQPLPAPVRRAAGPVPPRGANFDKKAWDAALKDYETLAARFPKSYLAPISLFNAAVCVEEKGDADSALKLYVQAVRGLQGLHRRAAGRCSTPGASTRPRATGPTRRRRTSRWTACMPRACGHGWPRTGWSS